jgi:hypothetical protein
MDFVSYSLLALQLCVGLGILYGDDNIKIDLREKECQDME